MNNIIDKIATIEVAGAPLFVAEDKFREGQMTEGVQIARIGATFKEKFLDKTETDIASATLHVHRLNEKLQENFIRAKLRLGAGAETALIHLWELLKQQGLGNPGHLRVNTLVNILYINDVAGETEAVGVSFFANAGWVIGADSLAGPRNLYAGCQIISR